MGLHALIVRRRRTRIYERASRLTAIAVALACAPLLSAAEVLRFSAPEGAVLNEFYRQGLVAAHAVLTSGKTPRIVVAFPAGNSGAAVWFEADSGAVAWGTDVKMESAEQTLDGGAVLRGVSFDLTATGGSLRVRQVIASSVRVIRNYQDDGKLESAVAVAPNVSERKVVWRRKRLDGAAGYLLSIEMLQGAVEAGPQIELVSDSNKRMQMRVTALTADEPLSPLEEGDLLNQFAAPDEALRNALAFLSYEGKLLAGSWRFNTYFGRDTLMSLRLLAPVLKPPAFEAGMSAVLERLNEAGEVAHEEDIGEFAILRRREAGLAPGAAPVFDYKMIDDDFLLAPVAAHALLDAQSNRTQAVTFLARRSRAGDAYGARLVRNFSYVVQASAPFARDARFDRLIALKPGERVGNWRDSNDGLGGGRYAYDVNAVLAPAALAAIARLHASELLDPYVDRESAALLSQAESVGEAWRRSAPPLFDVTLPSHEARTEVRDYARSIGVPVDTALQSLGSEAIRFRAIALDAQGRPIPVQHSDEGFALLFLDPAPAEVERIARSLTRPFPAGLLTDAGLLVANPAYAPSGLEPLFERTRYHGAVIWSWQQAMLAAGFERQLARKDLTSSARTALTQAQARVTAAINAAKALRGSELWSWSVANGRYRAEPFGQRAEDETESNAAQLWSTVHLAGKD